MERTLTVNISPDHGGIAEITIIDAETGETKTFYTGGYNNTDEKAKEIGWEIMSWADIAIEDFMENE